MPDKFDPREYESASVRLRAYLDQIDTVYSGKNRIDDFDLLRNYLAVKFELGRIPTEVEIGKLGKFSKTNYRNHFGTYWSFLEIIGVDSSLMHRRKRRKKANEGGDIDPQSRCRSIFDLIREFQHLKAKIHRNPSRREFTAFSKSESSRVYDFIVALEDLSSGKQSQKGFREKITSRRFPRRP